MGRGSRAVAAGSRRPRRHSVVVCSRLRSAQPWSGPTRSASMMRSAPWSSASPAIFRRTARRATPCCSSSACRGSALRCWSAPRSPRLVRPIRACSATRWSPPISWASRPVPASVPCSASSSRSPVLGIQLLAFVVGLGTVGLVLLIASSVRGREPVLVLVLAGVVVGALAGSAVSLLKILADPTTSCRRSPSGYSAALPPSNSRTSRRRCRSRCWA